MTFNLLSVPSLEWALIYLKSNFWGGKVKNLPGLKILMQALLGKNKSLKDTQCSPNTHTYNTTVHTLTYPIEHTWHTRLQLRVLSHLIYQAIMIFRRIESKPKIISGLFIVLLAWFGIRDDVIESRQPISCLCYVALRRIWRWISKTTSPMSNSL